MHGKEQKDLMSAVSARSISHASGVDQVRDLQRVLYRCAKQDRRTARTALFAGSPAATGSVGHGPPTAYCLSVNDVGEPGAGEPHARFEVAAGGNPASRLVRTARKPPADPTMDLLYGYLQICRF